MNFGEKFPYALLTFSQSLSKLVIGGVHLLPKVCRSWLLATPSPKSLSKLVIGHTCSTHAHLLPKVCRSWLLGTLHPNHYPHAQLHINPIPHTPTPTIHPPYTIPQPRPYPSSCELTATKWGKTARFVAHEALECSLRPRMGPKVHEVDSALARAQTKVDEVYGPYGSSPNPAEVAPSKFP